MLCTVWYVLYTWITYSLANSSRREMQTLTLNKIAFTAVWYARMTLAENNPDEWVVVDQSFVWDIVFFDIIAWAMFFLCYLITIIRV